MQRCHPRPVIVGFIRSSPFQRRMILVLVFTIFVQLFACLHNISDYKVQTMQFCTLGTGQKLFPKTAGAFRLHSCNYVGVVGC